MVREVLKTDSCEIARCILTVRDALEALHGKWKLPILVSLTSGSKRFKEISKAMNGITDRMLSKELKELEADQLIQRTVHDSFPQKVEYTITAHGLSLETVITSLQNWGIQHRKKIIGK